MRLPHLFLDAGMAFPYQAFPRSMLEIATAYQAKNQAPGATNLSVMLSELSTVWSPAYDVEGLNGSAIPLSTYMLIISQTGEGKTSATNTVYRPIFEYERRVRSTREELFVKYKDELRLWSVKQKELERVYRKHLGKSSEIEVLRAIEDHNLKRPNTPRFINLVVSDTTLAGMRRVFQDGRQSGVIVNSDAGEFVNKELITNATAYCSAWSGESFHVERAKSSIHIDDPRVSMLLLVQPIFIEDSILKEGSRFRESGLSGRFVVLFPTSRIGKRNFSCEVTVDQGIAIRGWENRIFNELVRLYGRDGKSYPSQRIVISLSVEAKAYLSNLQLKIEEDMRDGGRYYAIKEVATKATEHMCRIAALYALWEHPEKESITLTDATYAAEFIYSYLDSYGSLVTPTYPTRRQIDDANVLLQYLATKIGQGFGEYTYITPNHHEYTFPKMRVQHSGPEQLRREYRLGPALDLLVINGRVAVGKWAIYGRPNPVATIRLLNLNPVQAFQF